MIIAIKYIHLLSISIWMGSMIFFSFIAAPAIFKALERETAGDVVGLIFPRYYAIGYICGLISLVTLWLMSTRGGLENGTRGAFVALGLMLGLTVFSGMVIGPRAAAVKQQMRAETDETKLGVLKAKFKSIHGISMALNIAVMLLGLILIYFTTIYMIGPRVHVEVPSVE